MLFIGDDWAEAHHDIEIEDEAGRVLDALRVFDVFFVFFGNRPDTQTMAIYAQSTIVGDGHVGYGAAISVAIFLIISLFVVIYMVFMRVTEE